MGFTISQKIINNHLLCGDIHAKGEIGLKIDQTLTQDATGTMVYLEFETLNIPRIKTKLSVAYIDHNTLQTGFENADDHKFIQSAAAKYGLYFSRPGNGICHQVHLERFAVPGETLIGSDSHTPTCGALGMLSMGAGGLDVAVAMAGGAYFINNPKIVGVELKGKLKPWVSSKDIILKLLSIMGVKGGVGKIIEYMCDGVQTLSVPERATMTNMGAELGATTSIFPSDDITLDFLKSQEREDVFSRILPDNDAVYDEKHQIDLSTLEPLVACPHSPDSIKPASELNNIIIDQVCIGSCTNSSYTDLMKVASILKGKTIHSNVSLTISPGSKQVYNMLAQNGSLADMINSGARILECSCGPCIGMGQSPNSQGVSLRTFNRNFEGRSGTKDSQIYLSSPETAAASALEGRIVDPRTLGEYLNIETPKKFIINDNMIISPKNKEESQNIELKKGPNIKSIPITNDFCDNIESSVVIKVGDNITTDHIMPAGSKILPYRSNIPYISKFCFNAVDPEFVLRCKNNNDYGIIIAGFNYGQGSSREHAALVPLYLGIRVIIAKSFARIHFSNLINAGILPMVFYDDIDYDNIDTDDFLLLKNLKESLSSSSDFIVNNITKNMKFKAKNMLSSRQSNILLEGGLLNYTKKSNI